MVKLEKHILFLETTLNRFKCICLNFTFRKSLGLFARAFFLLSISGCWIFDLDRKEQKSPVAVKLLDRSREMMIERVDHRAAIYLRFYTTNLAHCIIEVWPKYLGNSPAQGDKEVVDCGYQGPTDQHLVRIENVRNYDPNFYRILVGPSKGFQTASDVITLEESADNMTFFPPPGYEKLSSNPHTGTVVRAVLPLGQGKIHSKKITSSALSSETSNFLAIKEGCTSGIRKSYTPFLPPTKSRLDSISTNGYIISSSRKIEDRFDTFSLDFTEKVPNKQTWDFTVSHSGEKSKAAFKAPSEFNYIKLRSGNEKEMSLAKASLTVGSGVFDVSHENDLYLIWDYTNKDESNYISLLFGKNSMGPSLKCIYKAEKGSAVISSKYLQGLKGSTLDLVVTLNSKQISNISANHSLFLHTQDWRHKLVKITGSL